MGRSRALILLAVMILATAAFSFGEVAISVNFGPPVLPVYAQPLCPGPGYIWVPGYWAWSPAFGDYYWVPGTWALAPQVGFLWTPGYWAFSAGFYNWYPGYWGPTVGFYGGVNYGFGYTGYGYSGGYWRGRDFYYNRSVNNINVTNIRNVYNQPVATPYGNANRVAYNGGPGGVQARPTSTQLAAQRQQHIPATSAQVQHEQAARNDPAQFVGRNQGRPAVAATPRPGALNASGAVRAPLPAVNRTAANQQANGGARPAQNNPQARAPQNVPHPPQNNQQVRTPQNNQQARAPQNVPHPNNTARQAAPAPRVNEAPRPNMSANNRPAPQPAPQVHNAPRQEMAQHAAPAPRPAPQQQARQVNQPPRPAPQPAPQQHAMSRPAPNMTPRAPQPRQAEPPRQSAAHQPPQEQRPH